MTSALLGFSRVLALTSTTSSGVLADFQRSASGNLKWIESATACNRIDSKRAEPSTRSRTSRPDPKRPIRSLAMVKCNLTSILQAVHILGFSRWLRCVFRHGYPAESLAINACYRAFQQIDRAQLEPHAAARVERRQRGHPGRQGQALEPDEVLPQHDRQH